MRGNGERIGPQNLPTSSIAGGIWNLLNQQRAQQRGAWPSATPAVVTDPYFMYVPLLLNTTSTNGQQNNTFLDSSSNTFTITRNGTPTQGSFTPYQPSGYWSGVFNGSSDYLTAGAASNWTFLHNGSNWTIEFFVFHSGSSLYGTVGTTAFGAQIGMSVFFNNTNNSGLVNGAQVYFANGSGDAAFNSSAALVQNAWNYVAITFTSSTKTCAFYINGATAGSSSNTGFSYNASAPTNTLGIGRYQGSSPGGYLPGYISNLRISNVVRTSITSAPVVPYSSDANTSLLTLQSNRFIDNSTNAFAITVNGTPKVQAFQPFAPAASYDASTYGGSGYFKTTDYLAAPNNTAFAVGTGNFTVEGWCYLTTLNSDYNIIFQVYDGTREITLRVGANAVSNRIQAAFGSGAASVYESSSYTSATMLNQWVHLALCKNGDSTTFYYNGVAVQTRTGTSSISIGTPVNVNINFPSPNYFLGYISNLRFVKGTAVYTAAFTPPTLPLTAVSGTSLLANFTNAGIYDAAWQNNALTVGDAQVSTTITAKWPPTSMKFDGTGDIISAPASQGFVFTGNLTVEGWVWIDSTMASSRPDGLKVFIFVGWDTGNTPQFFVTGTSTTPGTGLGYYDGTTGYIATVTIPKDQWVYLAFVRSGSAIYGYVNGTQYTITASYSSTIGSSNTFVIGGNPNQSAAYYSYLKGYIQDLRITKGVARTITTPTAAFPTR
jgi:hypothetical protein